MEISIFFSHNFGLRLRVSKIPEAGGFQASGFSLGFSFRVPGCRLPAFCVLQRSLVLTPAVRRRSVNGYNACNIHDIVHWCVSSIPDHAKPSNVNMVRCRVHLRQTRRSGESRHSKLPGPNIKKKPPAPICFPSSNRNTHLHIAQGFGTRVVPHDILFIPQYVALKALNQR